VARRHDLPKRTVFDAVVAGKGGKGITGPH
jgi:hypothetical protein